MALINCPECGKEISDKAQVCPNCGVPLDNYVIVCPDCGQEISNKANACPNCGRPISDNKITVNTVPGSKDTNAGKNTANLFFALAILAAFIWVICWYYEASHGVRLAEEEIYYTVSNYKSTTFILGRVCAIAKPICIIIGLIFTVLGFLKKNNKI